MTTTEKTSKTSTTQSTSKIFTTETTRKVTTTEWTTEEPITRHELTTETTPKVTTTEWTTEEPITRHELTTEHPKEYDEEEVLFLEEAPRNQKIVSLTKIPTESDGNQPIAPKVISTDNDNHKSKSEKKVSILDSIFSFFKF
jgi:hypothetical protein